MCVCERERNVNVGKIMYVKCKIMYVFMHINVHSAQCMQLLVLLSNVVVSSMHAGTADHLGHMYTFTEQCLFHSGIHSMSHHPSSIIHNLLRIHTYTITH